MWERYSCDWGAVFKNHVIGQMTTSHSGKGQGGEFITENRNWVEQERERKRGRKWIIRKAHRLDKLLRSPCHRVGTWQRNPEKSDYLMRLMYVLGLRHNQEHNIISSLINFSWVGQSNVGMSTNCCHPHSQWIDLWIGRLPHLLIQSSRYIW